MNERQKTLLARIEAAFEKVPRPAYTTKRVARGLDDNWRLSDKEWKSLYAQDEECHWWEVAAPDLIHYQDIFAFLHSDGVLFYGVAHMAYAIRNNDSGHCSCLVSSICRNSLPDLSHEQRKCILEFLEFYRFKSSGLEDDIIDYAVAVLNKRPPTIPFDQFMAKHIQAMNTRTEQIRPMRKGGFDETLS